MLYSCNRCHVVLSDPDIIPGANYPLGPTVIEAWCQMTRLQVVSGVLLEPMKIKHGGDDV